MGRIQFGMGDELAAAGIQLRSLTADPIRTSGMGYASSRSSRASMKTLVALFLSSAAFGTTICAVYWFSSHDRGGSLLLGFMSIGLAWAAGYAIVAERNSNLAGDDPQLQHKKRAGEELGIVTKQSAWPVCLAFSVLWLLLGVVWSDFMIFTGLAAVLLCLWRLGAESARV